VRVVGWCGLGWCSSRRGVGCRIWLAGWLGWDELDEFWLMQDDGSGLLNSTASWRSYSPKLHSTRTSTTVYTSKLDLEDDLPRPRITFLSCRVFAAAHGPPIINILPRLDHFTKSFRSTQVATCYGPWEVAMSISPYMIFPCSVGFGLREDDTATVDLSMSSTIYGRVEGPPRDIDDWMFSCVNSSTQTRNYMM
jgi:hypothetical protein